MGVINRKKCDRLGCETEFDSDALYCSEACAVHPGPVRPFNRKEGGRKPIAIDGTTVLCDDGTIWYYENDRDEFGELLENRQWKLLPEVPQGKTEDYRKSLTPKPEKE